MRASCPVRADQAEAEEAPRARLKRRRARLRKPRRNALRQAIEEPARHVGLELEEGLIDTILDDAGTEPASLPLLEYALLELWQRRRGTMLTLEGYRDAGGVRDALAKRADQVIAGLSPRELEITRRTLLRLTQPGEGTEDTRRRAPEFPELAGCSRPTSGSSMTR